MSLSGKIRVKKSGVTNDKLVNNRGLTVPTVNFADSFMFSEFGNEELLEYNHEEQTWYLDMKKMFPGIDRFKITDPIKGDILIYDVESDKFINDSTFLDQLQSIQKNIEKFTKDIEELKSDDIDVEKTIKEINTNIEKLTTSITDIEKNLNESKESIEELTNRSNLLDEKIGVVNTDITEINQTIINITSEITNIKDDVVDLNEIKEDISDINQKIDSNINPHLNRIDVEIDDIQRKINIPANDLSTQIKHFTDQINQLYYIIERQQNVIDGLNNNTGLPNFRYDMVDKEVPTGLINGINTIFTLEKTPVIGSEFIFLNGVLQDSVRDYSIQGSQLVFVEPPLENMVIRCNYRISVNSPTEISNPILYNIEYGETPAYFYSLIEKEIPIIKPNGEITSFELMDEPIVGSESVFLNGVLQEPGPGELSNYILENKNIVFVEPPLEGMVIRCTYRKFIKNL
jgi:predicted  nucleic acid-binding Zn-ribbon protein